MLPARITQTTAESVELPARTRCANLYARLLLNTSAAALNATCTRRGRLELAQRDCTSAAARLMTATCEKGRATIPKSRKTKFGEIVPSIPGILTFKAEARAARPK